LHECMRARSQAIYSTSYQSVIPKP
jgi:hypothetical protein